MSDIGKKEIEMLGALSRLKLNEEELEALTHDLKRVIDYVELLQEVDVSDLAPYSHVEEQGIGALREDEVKETLPRDVFLKNAPDQVGGMIRVPPVIKQTP